MSGWIHPGVIPKNSSNLKVLIQTMLYIVLMQCIIWLLVRSISSNGVWLICMVINSRALGITIILGTLLQTKMMVVIGRPMEGLVISLFGIPIIKPQHLIGFSGKSFQEQTVSTISESIGTGTLTVLINRKEKMPSHINWSVKQAYSWMPGMPMEWSIKQLRIRETSVVSDLFFLSKDQYMLHHKQIHIGSGFTNILCQMVKWITKVSSELSAQIWIIQMREFTIWRLLLVSHVKVATPTTNTEIVEAAGNQDI